MRDNIRKLILLLIAVAMVFSHATVSASAVEKVSTPTVTLNSGIQTQHKFIYANSVYNSLDRMPEVADTVTGSYNGNNVELIPEWNRPSGLFNGFYGSMDRYYDSNTFTADSFTVKNTGERVQAAPGTQVTLNVRVIAVHANLHTDNKTINITKSEALAVKDDSNLASVLGIPTEVGVSYESARFNDHSDWDTAAGVLDSSQAPNTYAVTGWDMFSYNADLSPTTLRNIAGEVNAEPREVTLIPKYSGAPKWAAVNWGDATITLTVTPDSPAIVTVTPPDSITYGQTLRKPSATATVGGKTLTNAAFIFTYEGIEETAYSKNTVPPTDAGKYKVTASLTTPGYFGEASAEFTISKADCAAAEAYILVDNKSSKTIMIDEYFIRSDMAKGATIKERTAIAPGGLIESFTVQAGAKEFTLTPRDNAPNGSSQTFTLILQSDNYTTVNVSVTVYNDTVAVTGAKLKDSTTEFPSGTALSEIVDLSGCTATVNSSFTQGTFVLMDSGQKLTGPNKYENWSVAVWFTTTAGIKYQVMVSVPDFTVRSPVQPGGDQPLGDDDNLEYYITIYANSKYNQNAQALLNLLKTRKGSYTFGGKTYTAVWKAVGNNAAFNPKGYAENVWYTYTAALTGSSKKPKAYIRVIPVNSTLLSSNGSRSKTMKAETVTALTEKNWKTALGLPSTATFKNEPAQESNFLEEQDKFQTQNQPSSYPITGWKMDGKSLTLSTLKKKADSTVNKNAKITLTPVYAAPAWATVKSKAPTFQLTITPKSAVKVSKITLSGISKKITAGKKIKLTAKVSPSNATNQAVTWRSDNTKVATVNSKGIVTLKRNAGGKKVTITATTKDGSKKKATYTITSIKDVVTKVTISGKKTRTLKAGKTLSLKAKVTASNSKKANKTLKWSSSNKKYATVSSTGKVKTKKAGKKKTVTITAMATDGSNKKASVKIKLK